MDPFLHEFTLGMWQANCYVLGDRDAGVAAVIDPGQDAVAPVRALLEREGVRCDTVLLTHGHIDHLWSAPDLGRLLDAPVFVHPDDGWLWDNPARGFADAPVELLEQQFGLRWDTAGVRTEKLADGQRLTAGGLRLEVRHTPGHTPGSCVFLLRGPRAAAGPWLRNGPAPVDADLLLTGDLLFAGSVGRTDLPRGSTADLLASIERAVLPLDDATVVAAGHGSRTTVGQERRSNPFLP